MAHKMLGETLLKQGGGNEEGLKHVDAALALDPANLHFMIAATHARRKLGVSIYDV